MYKLNIGINIFKIALIALGALTPFSTFSAPIENTRTVSEMTSAVFSNNRKDHLVIRVDKTDCSDIRVSAIDNGCHTINYCKNLKSCVCASAGQTIIWTPEKTIGLFKLKFNPKILRFVIPTKKEMIDSIFNFKYASTMIDINSPLEDNCKSNFEHGNLICKIRETVESKTMYSYSVKLSGCENVKDPILIIQDPTQDPTRSERDH